ncbi:hypothetical protein [Corynebacterium riegelii]|uniref:hypothetical protein n=1 Tax=Corynebacterium riegelii TaxID=156976 RepID=UPI000C76B6D8|nr:hypothetical protein [Corynebacterium riegelii]PLA14982.1 hypothetical protein CYJ48_01455 [Corynebacterium riegelii]QQU84817.1 hypothetical protein I6I71_04625 [Corynebacterium riegelii]
MHGFVRSVASDIFTRTNVTILALVVFVGLLGLRGGFEKADPEGFIHASAPVGINALAQPVEVEVAPFDIQIRKTYVLDGSRVVEMSLTNTQSRPVTRLLSAFDLEVSGLPEEQQPRFLVSAARRSPGGEPLELPVYDVINPNPGVPLDIAVVFTPADEGPQGQQLIDAADTLTIWTLEYKRSFLDNQMMWLPTQRMAEVSLR